MNRMNTGRIPKQILVLSQEDKDQSDIQ